jgi:hypothetical protein
MSGQSIFCTLSELRYSLTGGAQTSDWPSEKGQINMT